jgi:tRNA pseudouridine55 synthase
LLVDKPEGPTSHDVVARARRLFRTKAVGHTGTLDPFATGLLVLVFGGATRLARWAERHRKIYRAEVRLGSSTDTDDRTGAVLAERTPASWPGRDEVAAAMAALTGTRLQRPPAYSAKRIEGERSHRLARRGGNPQPEPVEVTVFSFELLEYAPPMLSFRAEVSPGTYVRAMGRDLGERLGVGAHLTGLRRESIGPWRVTDAIPLTDLSGSEPLLPPRTLVADLPSVALDPAEVLAVGHGRVVLRPGPTSGEAALLDGDRLLAVAQAVPSGWHPVVVLA